MAKLKDGLYKQINSSYGNNDYVLLAGGGSKALSDFATATNVSNKLTLKYGTSETEAWEYDGSVAKTLTIKGGDKVSIEGGNNGVITINTSVEDGRGIDSIALYNTNGNVDRYKITYTDNTTSYFNVTNGTTPTTYVKTINGAHGEVISNYTPSVNENTPGVYTIGTVTIAGKDHILYGKDTYATSSNLEDLGTLTIGSKTYNGSANVEVTASDLNLGTALKYCGITTTNIADESTTNPIKINDANHNATPGCVVFYGDKEFIWNGSKWEEFGYPIDLSGYKTKQTEVNSADSTNNEGTTFVTSLTQDTNGVIKYNTGEVTKASSSAFGIVKIGDGLTSTGGVIKHSDNNHIPSGGSSGQFLGWDSSGKAKWVNNPNTDESCTAAGHYTPDTEDTNKKQSAGTDKYISAIKLDTNKHVIGIDTANLPTFSESYLGTVTEIKTGIGLTGGPISSNGTIKCNLDSQFSLGTVGTTSKLYYVGVDSKGKLVVQVPWENTHRTIECDGSSIDDNDLNLRAGDNISLTLINGEITIDAVYGAEKGITLKSGKFGHSNAEITKKTSYGSTATTASADGGTIKVTDIQHDAYGHITSSKDRTITLSQTKYSAGTGLKLDGTVFNHDNQVDAVATAGLLKVKYDAQGHITGSAQVTASDLPSHTHGYWTWDENAIKAVKVNNAGYADSAGSAPASDVYAWAKAATKPTYTASEVGAMAAGDTSHGTHVTSGAQTWSGKKTFSGGIASSADVTVTGKVTASSGFFESSDERLKSFKDPLKVDLEKLSQIRKSYFTFNDNPDQLQIGISAQEIQTIYPEIVMEDEDGMLSVAYDKLSVIALEAIDDLYQDYKNLKSRVDKLEKLLINRVVS